MINVDEAGERLTCSLSFNRVTRELVAGLIDHVISDEGVCIL